MVSLKSILSSYDLIFWDFDGVIKESVALKGDCFCDLFPGITLSQKNYIYDYHLANGGISRSIKILHYIDYLGLKLSNLEKTELITKFGSLVFNKTVQSSWVPGVEAYIKNNPFNQKFYLISGTPQHELNSIVEQLDIDHCFLEVAGSPQDKTDYVAQILLHYPSSTSSLFVGDALTDYVAARASNIPFLFREHYLNSHLLLPRDTNVYRCQDFVLK